MFITAIKTPHGQRTRSVRTRFYPDSIAYRIPEREIFICPTDITQRLLDGWTCRGGGGGRWAFECLISIYIYIEKKLKILLPCYRNYSSLVMRLTLSKCVKWWIASKLLGSPPKFKRTTHRAPYETNRGPANELFPLLKVTNPLQCSYGHKAVSPPPPPSRCWMVMSRWRTSLSSSSAGEEFLV